MIEKIRGYETAASKRRNEHRGDTKAWTIGPLIGGLPITVGSGTAGAVTYSPGVPGAAVVGGT